MCTCKGGGLLWSLQVAVRRSPMDGLFQRDRLIAYSATAEPHNVQTDDRGPREHTNSIGRDCNCHYHMQRMIPHRSHLVSVVCEFAVEVHRVGGDADITESGDLTRRLCFRAVISVQETTCHHPQETHHLHIPYNLNAIQLSFIEAQATSYRNDFEIATTFGSA